jgi:hypothetical protein
VHVHLYVPTFPPLPAQMLRRPRTQDRQTTTRQERYAVLGSQGRTRSGIGVEQLADKAKPGFAEHLASVVDADRDGTMHLDEYTNAFAHGCGRGGSFEQGDRSFLDAIMAVADTDRGNAPCRCVQRMTGALMHLPEANARECHRRLNADGDGLVTTQTRTRSTIAMSTTTPTESGSWLLGPTTD